MLVIGFLTLAGQLLYADTPLRVEGFWLSRPVGPAAMGASKVVWILILAWIVPVGLESSRALIGGGIWLLGALLVIWVQYARRRFALGFGCLAGVGLFRKLLSL